MEVVTLRALEDNFVYALVAGSDVAVVDPGDAAPVVEFVRHRGLRVTHVLLTHHHADHVGGAPELAAEFGCEILCSLIDRPRIPSATRVLDDGDAFAVCGSTARALATPGHTRGQVAYWFEAEGALFTGDTLFSAGCGRLFEGSATEMFGSLRRLDALAADARVYFGHEYTLKNLAFTEAHLDLASDLRGLGPDVIAYRAEVAAKLAAGRPSTPTTLARERTVNAFLRARTVAEFARLRKARDTF